MNELFDPETKTVPLPTCEEQIEHIDRLIAEAREMLEHSNVLLDKLTCPSGSLETK